MAQSYCNSNGVWINEPVRQRLTGTTQQIGLLMFKPFSFSRLLSHYLAPCLLALALWGGAQPALAQAQALTPAQMAWLKAEWRKADAQFAKDVVRITGATANQVARAAPPEGRITNPAANLIAKLERIIGKSLSEEQKIAIYAAEAQRQTQVENARLTAAKH
jgi:hypothetical protein